MNKITRLWLHFLVTVHFVYFCRRAKAFFVASSVGSLGQKKARVVVAQPPPQSVRARALSESSFRSHFRVNDKNKRAIVYCFCVFIPNLKFCVLYSKIWKPFLCCFVGVSGGALCSYRCLLCCVVVMRGVVWWWQDEVVGAAAAGCGRRREEEASASQTWWVRIAL